MRGCRVSLTVTPFLLPSHTVGPNLLLGAAKPLEGKEDADSANYYIFCTKKSSAAANKNSEINYF